MNKAEIELRAEVERLRGEAAKSLLAQLELRAEAARLRGELLASKSMLAQREAQLKMQTCECGDIRPTGEFCHICGKCQTGCCMCVSIQRYEQSRVDLAACRRKLQSAENAAKYWEEKAKQKSPCNE
jgi:hypothetical protein